MRYVDFTKDNNARWMDPDVNPSVNQHIQEQALSDQLMKAWDASKHPRGQPTNAGQFRSASSGPGISHQSLISSGAVRGIEGDFPEEFLKQVDSAMKKSMAKYPSLKIGKLRRIEAGIATMGMRTGNLEVSSKLLEDIYAYTKMNDYIARQGDAGYVTTVESQINEYGPLSPQAKNLKRAIALVESGEVPKPSTYFVADTINDMINHEIGHLALSAGRREAEAISSGFDNGGIDYQLMDDTALKSAMKLSYYATESAEEWAAEAWAAKETGQDHLLDALSRKLVANIERALKAQDRKSGTASQRRA